MKIALQTNYTNLHIEFIESVKAFYPFCTYVETDEDVIIDIHFQDFEKNIKCVLIVDDEVLEESIISRNNNPIEQQRELKKQAKLLIYKYLSGLLCMSLPYGSLTGVRPTKLYKLLNAENNAYKILKDEYLVDVKKLNLIKEIVDFQSKFKAKENDIDLYINIPFCDTRCSYCSFITQEKLKLEKYYPFYLKTLKKDILSTLEIINKNSRNIRSIYVGGGTPTILSGEEIKNIFSVLMSINSEEYTFESGRPDSISEEKLLAIRSVGANRISINPQTFKKETLKIINRAHTIDDIYKSIDMAKKFNFRINMDLITMLPRESAEDFENSLNECLKLQPNDITIHSLTLKRGSKLTEENYENSYYELSQKVNAFSEERLSKSGYYPYYLYRLKKSSGGLENLGYTKEDTPCLYNIDSMEEECDIITCGAGSITKMIKNNEIRRLPITKDIGGYINNIDNIVKAKEDFLK